MKILITGASGGLGNIISKYFYNEKNNLIFIARNHSLSTIKNNFPNQTYFDIDLINDKVDEKLNLLDSNNIPEVIIHCAGGKLENDEHPINIKILEDTIKLNCTSAISINNFFIKKALNKHKSLRIIHISSDAGITGKASPSYSISKGSLNTYIKNSGRFYAKNNIMICGIICSIFEHENSVWTKKREINSDYYNKTRESTTLKRFARAEEIAEIVIFIAESSNMLYSAEHINITAGNT